MANRAGICVWAIVVGLNLAATSLLAAQQYGGVARLDEPREESLYYQQPGQRPDAQAIIHEKAQTRAYQRQARLASLSWYGMSNARPTAAPTPFTSLYSPVWQMPGGRPYAWHSRGWPTYIYYTR
jgi:hypothetical protein